MVSLPQHWVLQSICLTTSNSQGKKKKKLLGNREIQHRALFSATSSRCTFYQKILPRKIPKVLRGWNISTHPINSYHFWAGNTTGKKSLLPIYNWMRNFTSRSESGELPSLALNLTRSADASIWGGGRHRASCPFGSVKLWKHTSQ